LNTQNKLEYFLVIWTILIGAATILYLSFKKKDSKISLVKEEEAELRVPEVSTEK